MSEATEARDVGLEQVRESNSVWCAEALVAVKALPDGMFFTGERLRHYLIGIGVSQPRHHNAWGALVMTACRRGYIEKTGVLIHMGDRRSHGRLTPEYRTVAE